jgi:type III secretory pathway component EscV
MAFHTAEVIMFSSSFKQQTSQWQQAFAQRQAAGPLQKLLAWLMLGVFLILGAGFLLFMLLLSWIVIPIMLFRHRAKVKAWQQQQQATANSQGSAQHGQPSSQRDPTVIEGEVLNKKQD